MQNRFLGIVVNTCRLLVSATFIFSGMVKLLDPVGVQLKVEEYLVATGLGSTPGSVWTLLGAVGLSLAEFCLGVYLFFGIRRRLTTWSLLLFMAAYTPLTLWIAATDAVVDCGCFGDAVHLTNWQTFGKNALLLAATALLWWQGKRLTRFISESVQWIVSMWSLLYGLFVAGLCIYAEPVIDFRPFHIGQHIPTAMQWPDNPEGLPAIIDFEIDPCVLADTSYTFLLVSPHLEQADDGDMDRINALCDYAHRHGYRFLGLTASGNEAIRRWQDLTGAEYDFDYMDEATLETVARSNPALVLLHAGTVVGKWSHNTLPAEAELTAPLHALPLAHPHAASYRRMLLRLLLGYVLPLLGLTLVDRFVFSLRWWRRKRQTAKNH